MKISFMASDIYMSASLGDGQGLGVPRVGLVRCLVPVPELDLARIDLFSLHVSDGVTS